MNARFNNKLSTLDLSIIIAIADFLTKDGVIKVVEPTKRPKSGITVYKHKKIGVGDV